MATFFFFFFFFFEPGVKLDEKSIENGLEGQKFLVVCLFWGGCHHPNLPFTKKEESWSRYCKLFNLLSKEEKYLVSIVGLGRSGGVEVAYFSRASLHNCIDSALLRDF